MVRRHCDFCLLFVSLLIDSLHLSLLSCILWKTGIHVFLFYHNFLLIFSLDYWFIHCPNVTFIIYLIWFHSEMGLLFKVLGTVIFDRCSLYSFLFDSTKLKRINHPQMLSSNGVKNRDISTDSWGPAIYVALAFTDITHQYHTESKEYASVCKTCKVFIWSI